MNGVQEGKSKTL